MWKPRCSRRVSFRTQWCDLIGFLLLAMVFLPRVLPAQEICPETSLLQNDDGTFDNAYCWSYTGIEPPEHGAWAECYDSDFVCGVQFVFTQVGDYDGQSMDVYVWEEAGGIPGNALCLLSGIQPGPPAIWPDFSEHDVQVCCVTGGPHFVGFRGYWVGAECAWYLAADEDGFPGCPLTFNALFDHYPHGWHHPGDMKPPIWGGCQSLGIREYSGVGDCEPNPTGVSTWGRIKSMF